MELSGTLINDRYKILSKIGEGGVSTVWLALDSTLNREVAIKVLSKSTTSSRIEDIIRFRNEANTVSRLLVPSIVRIYEVGEMDDNHYIVMENLEGKNLHKWITEGTTFSISESIEIIQGIGEALKQIHNANVVHRDIKPGNIIVNRNLEGKITPSYVKLIDFGLAQVREYNKQDSKEILGTLNYMSPEQSGVLKRNVDERSDLYSLGIVFYQLLTGQLPFIGNHINSVIYQHIARVPVKPTNLNTSIPDILEKIVLKLLEKEPEQRYQSASGLLCDLIKFKEGIEDFTLAMEDKNVKLNFRTRLVGREEEVQAIQQMYQKALSGKGSVCMVSGEAGKGKTRLTEELRSYVFGQNGVMIDGKCFSGETKTPYAPLKEAVDKYIKLFVQYPEDKKTKIRNLVKDQIGILGQIILNLSPMLKEIVGECPPLIKLEPERENKRFQIVVNQFFRCLAELEGALVLMIDDMQWSDEGTIELFAGLISGIDSSSLMVTATYREDEVLDTHSLKRVIMVAKENNYPIHEISLKPFDLQKMTRFLSDILFDNIENAQEISTLLLKESKGNPLFAIEIVKQLVNEEVLTFSNHSWRLSANKLAQIEIATSLVDILMKRISKLAPHEVKVLSYAAVVGKKFSIDFLFLIGEISREEIVSIVDKAIDLQLLDEDHSDRGKILFAHDRIKEAFYKNIGDEKRKEVHITIANLLEESNSELLDKVVFELAHHYLVGEDFEKALEYLYLAGLKAWSTFAYEESAKHFRMAAAILENTGRISSERWIDCVEGEGFMSFMSNKHIEALALLEKVVPFVTDSLRKAQILKYIAHAHFIVGNWEQSEETGRAGLILLGERIPRHTLGQTFAISKELLKMVFKRVIKQKGFGEYVGKKISDVDQKRYQLINSFFYVLSWCFVLRNLSNLLYVSMRAVNVSAVKLGKSRELCVGLSGCSSISMHTGNFKLAEGFFKDAKEIIDDIGDEWGLAQYFQMYAYYCEYVGEYEKAIEYSTKSRELFRKIGDYTEETMSINQIIHSYQNLGDYENLVNILNLYNGNAQKMKDSYAMAAAHIYFAGYYIEKENILKAEEHINAGMEITCECKDNFNYCILNALLGRLYILKEDSHKALEYLKKAKALKEKHKFLDQYTNMIYSTLAEAQMMDYNNAKKTMNDKQRLKALQQIKKMCLVANRKTRKWASLYGFTLLISAKYSYLAERYIEAEKLHIKSIEHSKKFKRKYEQAAALCEYGIFLKLLSKYEQSQNRLEESYALFQSIDNQAGVLKVAKLLGIHETKSDSTERFSKELMVSKRLETIISLSQDLSSILDFEKLIDKLISVAIEVTGAQNGSILIIDAKSALIKEIKKISSQVGLSNQYKISQNIIQQVVASGKPVITVNAKDDERYNEFDSIVLNEIKSVLCVPITYNSEILGVCYLDNSLSSAVFTEEDSDILSVIMTQAAISIENARLYKQAITDGLTELITHKHFKFMLEKELSSSQRYGRMFSLIMFDIDHFKNINDHYGHQAGDMVLKHIAVLAQNNFRTCDIIARYGGEEFTVILPETNIEGAFISAERFRMDVFKEIIPFGNQTIKVTISLGVAGFPDHAARPYTLIKAADTALYISKKSGRNQTTLGEKVEDQNDSLSFSTISLNHE